MPRPPDPLARIKLLAAAEAEFVEHGLEGAKVEQITRRAGISKGAFYLHFTSKDQLFRELVESFVARLAALTDQVMEQCQCNREASTELLLDQWVSMDLEVFEFLWQNRGLLRLLLEGGSGARFRYLVDDFLERMAAKSRHVIGECVSQGLYRQDLDVELASDLIAGAYDRLAHKILRHATRPDIRPALVRMQDMILFGLASDSFVASATPRRAAKVGPAAELGPAAAAPLASEPAVSSGPLSSVHLIEEPEGSPGVSDSFCSSQSAVSARSALTPSSPPRGRRTSRGSR